MIPGGLLPPQGQHHLYLMGLQQHAETLKKLGKHKVGGGCLYINKLADVDRKVLEGIIGKAVEKK